MKVDGETVGQIEKGLLVLLGVAQDDTEDDADYLADKIVGMRVFEDADEKMNLGITEVSGAILAVSQFTLYGDMRRGSVRRLMRRRVPSKRAGFMNIS